MTRAIVALLPALAWGLPTMLTIDWRRLPDVPGQGGAYGGFQDSDGGFIAPDAALTAFGYSGDGVFHNSSFTVNLTTGSWTSLPAAPVSGRQEVAATIIGRAAYFVGGFSYTAPYAYSDVLKLDQVEPGRWVWTSLPPLPYPLCSMGLASIGSRLYVSGGADYDSKAFYVATDRNGAIRGLGKRLLMLDTANLTAGWTRLEDLPGSPRYCHAFSAVGEQLIAMGGSLPNSSSVVDNWAYSTLTGQWKRLPDLPTSSSNFQTNGATIFMNRYLILVGGYQFEHVFYPNGSSGQTYGLSQRMCPVGVNSSGCRQHCAASSSIPDNTYMGGWAHEYDNDVFVYDAVRNLFGIAVGISTEEPALMPPNCGGFPVNDNVPQVNIHGNQIFAIGGECNDRMVAGKHYTHYPQLALIGTISIVQVVW